MFVFAPALVANIAGDHGFDMVAAIILNPDLVAGIIPRLVTLRTKRQMARLFDR